MPCSIPQSHISKNTLQYICSTTDEYSVRGPTPNDSVDSTDSRDSSCEGSFEEEVNLDEGSSSLTD